MNHRNLVRIALLCLSFAFALPAAADEDDAPADAISMYRPNYFTYAFAPEDDPFTGKEKFIKFQYSTKALLADFKNWSFNLGYTQKSFWDWFEDSKPFREHNFNPELFLRGDFDWKKSWVEFNRIHGGWEHESNGIGGGESRSWDRLSAEVRVTLRVPGRAVRLLLYPRAWYPMVGDDNPRLIDRLKYGQLAGALKLGFAPTQAGDEVLRIGFHLRAHSYMVEPALNLSKLSWLRDWKGLHLYAQRWSGHGESLLTNDRFTERWSLGLMVSKGE